MPVIGMFISCVVQIILIILELQIILSNGLATIIPVKEHDTQ